MKNKKARLDADRTARPLTRLIGHHHAGGRIGPGVVKPDAIEDVNTRQRILLNEQDRYKLACNLFMEAEVQGDVVGLLICMAAIADILKGWGASPNFCKWVS